MEQHKCPWCPFLPIIRTYSFSLLFSRTRILTFLPLKFTASQRHSVTASQPHNLTTLQPPTTSTMPQQQPSTPIRTPRAPGGLSTPVLRLKAPGGPSTPVLRLKAPDGPATPTLPPQAPGGPSDSSSLPIGTEWDGTFDNIPPGHYLVTRDERATCAFCRARWSPQDVIPTHHALKTFLAKEDKYKRTVLCIYCSFHLLGQAEIHVPAPVPHQSEPFGLHHTPCGAGRGLCEPIFGVLFLGGHHIAGP